MALRELSRLPPEAAGAEDMEPFAGVLRFEQLRTPLASAEDLRLPDLKELLVPSHLPCDRPVGRRT
jgi:hypothetical protein